MGVGPALFFFYIYFYFVFVLFFFLHARKFIYKIKNVRNKKKLPECPCIGKRLKYPRISRKFTKMPLAALVANARLLLVAGRFSGEIYGQPMVDPGISEVYDSNGGGLDGR